MKHSCKKKLKHWSHLSILPFGHHGKNQDITLTKLWVIEVNTKYLCIWRASCTLRIDSSIACLCNVVLHSLNVCACDMLDVHWVPFPPGELTVTILPVLTTAPRATQQYTMKPFIRRTAFWFPATFSHSIRLTDRWLNRFYTEGATKLLNQPVFTKTEAGRIHMTSVSILRYILVQPLRTTICVI